MDRWCFLNPYSSYSRFSLWLLLLWLVLCFLFRRRSWVVLLWLPIVGAMLFKTWKVFDVILRIRGARGPDAGWAGLALPFIFQALAIMVVVLGVGMVVVPRRKAWKWYTAVPAILLSLPLFWWAWTEDRWTLQVQMVDETGKPIPGLGVKPLFPYGPRTPDRETNLRDEYVFGDHEGQVEFHFDVNRSAGMDIFPKSFDENRAPLNKRQAWSLDITRRAADEPITIWYKRYRRTGSRSMEELFVDQVPNGRVVRVVVQFPPLDSMEPSTLRERVRAAFEALRHADQDGGRDYNLLCKTLEAVEFLPLLVDTYHQNEKLRSDVLDGLRIVAETLKDVYQGCQGLVKAIASDPSETLSPENAYRVDQMCRWAGVPYSSGQDPVAALEAAQAVMVARARPLRDIGLARGGTTRHVSPDGELGAVGPPGRPRGHPEAAGRQPQEQRGRIHGQAFALGDRHDRGGSCAAPGVGEPVGCRAGRQGHRRCQDERRDRHHRLGAAAGRESADHRAKRERLGPRTREPAVETHALTGGAARSGRLRGWASTGICR